jgi:two-component system phosphate regulon sensor histidine kinase PhoR
VRSRIFFKLMFVFLLVIGATAITLQLTVHKVWERTLHEQIERNLKQKTLMFAYRVEADRQHSLADIAAQEGQAAGARATVIDPTGKVLADSETDPSTMENHAQRKEFAAALAGHLGVDERSSRTLSVPFLYVAAPVSGGAVRLAYPLPEMEITDRPLAVALFWGSLAAFVFAVMVALVASQYVGRRLQRIVSFAERVAGGDLTARIASTSTDEIGQVAAALDKTTRRVEESYARVQTSQRELETLLNSMQDAVIAVDVDGRVQWANRGMSRLLLHAPRLNAPLIDSVRDPDFLAAIQKAAHDQVVTSARSNTIASGRTFDVTAAPMPGGGAVAVLRQRFPRAAHSADFHPGIHRDAARQSAGRQSRARVPGNHPQEFGPHVAPYGRPADAGPRRIGRAEVRHAAGQSRRIAAGRSGELSRSGTVVWRRTGD